jgi:hypothetical protein
VTSYSSSCKWSSSATSALSCSIFRPILRTRLCLSSVGSISSNFSKRLTVFFTKCLASCADSLKYTVPTSCIPKADSSAGELQTQRHKEPSYAFERALVRASLRYYRGHSASSCQTSHVRVEPQPTLAPLVKAHLSCHFYLFSTLREKSVYFFDFSFFVGNRRT